MSAIDFRVKNGLVVNEGAQILSDAESTNKDSGSLVVEGGVGIEKRLNVGTDLAVGGNTTLTGTLAVNGSTITTTGTGTASVFNTNATTLNLGQAATTVSIAATTGTTTVRNALTIGGAFTSNSGAANFQPANASITISPTGTGSVTISPATLGSINNMSIGATTASTGRFTNTTITGTLTAGGVTGTAGQALVSTGTGIEWATPNSINFGTTNVTIPTVNGNINATVAGTLVTTWTNTNINIPLTTGSTTTSTGALTVAGGVGIAERLYAGSIQNTPIGTVQRSSGAFTTLTSNAATTFTAGTASTSTSTGTVVVTGGVGVTGAVNTGLSSTFAGFSSTSTTTISPANASVTISPTGTGTVTIAPATTGNINNITIGGTTAQEGTFTNVNLTTGSVRFNTTQDQTGITWNRNTDGASILFFNTSDGDTDSRLEFNTRDNLNEYFRWTHTSGGTTTELLRLVANNTANGLTYRSNVVWHAANDGTGSGLDADLLDGLQLNSTTTNNEANTVVRTDANGYVNFGWINTISGQRTTQAITRIYASDDQFIRWYNISDFRDRIDVPTRSGGNASGTWAISISGNAATVTNGVYTTGNQSIAGQKTFTAGAGAITITNSDIRSNATSNWTGDPTTEGKIQYHSNRWYIVSDSSSNRIVQFRRSGTDVSHIDNSGNFVGNVTGNVSGNAGTVTDGVYLTGTQTITGVKYFQSNLGTTSGSLSNPPLQAFATGTNSAFMSFHRSGSYAVNMGLDSDNVLRIGGWSASANRLQLDMSGNLTIAGSFSAATSITAGGAITSGSTVTANFPLFINTQTIPTTTTITSVQNAVTAGPVTINNGVTVTVQGNWSIV